MYEQVLVIPNVGQDFVAAEVAYGNRYLLYFPLTAEGTIDNRVRVPWIRELVPGDRLVYGGTSVLTVE